MRTRRIRAADAIAGTIHAGDLDQQGNAYVLHLYAVTASVRRRARVVALLHDALEMHPDSWLYVGLVTTRREWAAIELLTRRSDETYMQYIDRIRRARGRPGRIAREVKRADLRHNLGRLTAELERLRPRYAAALERLAA